MGRLLHHPGGGTATVAGVRLTELAWPDIGELSAPTGRIGPIGEDSSGHKGRRPVLCIPVGSCEQHGPHLPLGTDTLIAEALARAAASEVDGMIVGPSLTVTASGEHAGFPGTLSIGTAVMTDVVLELGRSADWAAGIVLVNGHGGNRAAVDAAVDTLTAEGRHLLSWWPNIAGGDAHAGHTETSIMLAIHPGLVRLDEAQPGATAPLAELAGRLRAGGVAAVSPSGVLGDPGGASSAEGHAILGDLVEQLVAAVRSWAPPR